MAFLPPAGQAVVATQDAVVEGVDFIRAWTTPYQLGGRALAAALSDLAAMGARAHSCLATVCAPDDVTVEDLVAIHAGLLDAGRRHGCALAGGDLSATGGPLVIDVCALGVVDPDRVMRREAGRPGDALVVTGVLGRAAAGLRLLQDDLAGVRLDPAHAAAARLAQTSPAPRLEEGARLAAAGVRCAGDLSDGLLAGARLIAGASGCAAVLWIGALPVDAWLKSAFGPEWLGLAVAGGEDFELLAAVPATRLEGLLAAWAADRDAGPVPVTVVGRLLEGSGVRLLTGEGGVEITPPALRSRHWT